MALISLTSSGIKDFFVQRVTALIIIFYFTYLFIEVLCLTYSGRLNYYSWRELFIDGMFFRISTLITYLAIFFHAWVGIWIICGDYIKCTWASILVILNFILVYLFCFFWLLAILFFY